VFGGGLRPPRSGTQPNAPEFPLQNVGADGYERTPPVGQFPVNGYGLFEMIDNVWGCAE